MDVNRFLDEAAEILTPLPPSFDNRASRSIRAAQAYDLLERLLPEPVRSLDPDTRRKRVFSS